MPRTERCETCRWWVRLPEGHQEYSDENDPGTWCGKCHRNPPQVEAKPLPVSEDNADDMWTPLPYWFPVIEAGDFCGEWHAADQPGDSGPSTST